MSQLVTRVAPLLLLGALAPASAQSFSFPDFWPIDDGFSWPQLDPGGSCTDPCGCGLDDLFVFPDPGPPTTLPGKLVGDDPGGCFVLSNDGTTFTIHGGWDGQSFSTTSTGPASLGLVQDGTLVQFDTDDWILVRDWNAIDPALAAPYGVPQGQGPVLVWVWYDTNPSLHTTPPTCSNDHNTVFESNLPAGVQIPPGFVAEVTWFGLGLGPIASYDVDACTGAPWPPTPALPYVPHLDCNGNGQFDCVDLASGIATDLNANGVPDGCEAVGSSGCSPAVLNSTGFPAEMRALGSAVTADDSLVLAAHQLPPNQFGYFLNSLTSGLTPNAGGSQGNLCLTGAIGRYTSGLFDSGSSGTGILPLSLPATPTPLGVVAIQPGQTWFFQCWFRDLNPGATSNFTDIVSVTFL